MTRFAEISAAAAALWLLSACTTHDWTIRLGQFSDTTSAGITTPAVFHVGVPDTVSIHTVGNGCVRLANTTVTVQGLLATIQPVDSIMIRDVCTDQLATFTHKAAVTFQQAGTATIRILGRNDFVTNITVERTATVQ